jgi:tRNA A37 methylthiotransferase MiaB
MKEHLKTAKENKEKFLNKTAKVLIEEKLPESKDIFRGHDENYNIILVRGKKEMLKKEIEARITNISSHSMIGEAI